MNYHFPMALALGLFSTAAIFPATGQDVQKAAEEQIRPKSGPIPVNGMAAKVNGDVITLNELMIKVAPMQSVLMARFPRRGLVYEKQLSELKSGILDELIDRTIIFTEFKDRVKAFPDADIEAEVARIVQNVYNGDEELFRQYLKATNLTRDQFKEQQRKELLVQIVRAQHFGDVPPPKEAELREEYAGWSLANRDRKKDEGTYKRIYLRKDLGDGPAAQLKLAEEISKKLKEGEDFGALAEAHSNDSKAEDGGLWDKIPRTDLNHEFGYLLFETEGNDVMGPIEDNFGFNIIQVLKRDLGPPEKSFADARSLMKRRVESEKKKANFEKWMKKMRTRAAIQKMIK
ncbi:MAG: parvulin-like peptidyl-prolyl isomerase [Akkermansiaceae bacterium]|jgi:parvulin-like peptidyl-prolyl isomerase